MTYIECGRCLNVFSEYDARTLTMDDGWQGSTYIVCPECSGCMTTNPLSDELELSDMHEQIHNEPIVYSGSRLLTEAQAKELMDEEQTVG